MTEPALRPSAQALPQLLSVAQAVTADLGDPQRGAVGAILLAALGQSGCTENFDPDFAHDGGYYGHSFIGGAAVYPNEICYGPTALASPQKFLCKRFHEAVHALQSALAPVLHAHPANAAEAVLCPEDFLLCLEVMERDAYAKESWLSSLAAAQDPAVRRAQEQGSPVPCGLFGWLRDKDGLESALRWAAAQSLSHQFGAYGARGRQTVGDFYRHQALAVYGEMLEQRKNNPSLPPPVFVRASAADIARIGDTLGINITASYGEPDRYQPDLSSADRALLAQIRQEWSIARREDLPLFADFLSRQGQTPQDFMNRAKTITTAPPAP
jgi:hypothetical protein